MAITRILRERHEPSQANTVIAERAETPRSPYWSQQADRVFYVSIERDGKRGVLLGPYETHQEALNNVERGRRLAADTDPWADFDAFGTCSAPRSQPLRTVWGTR